MPAWRARGSLLALALVTTVTMPATAAPAAQRSELASSPTLAPRGQDFVVVPGQRRDSRAAPTIYLNRCQGGCQVSKDRNDAKANASTIIKTPGTLSQFAGDDTAWQALVACVRRTYQPFAVTVVDQEPADNYIEVMVGGTPGQLGLDGGTLGIAPLASDCSPQQNVLAFAFSDAHLTGETELCATVAHEAGHVYGLDHTFECRDPMTYLTGCGAKSFLHLDLPCGEFEPPTRACKCGATQNTHGKLLSALDPGVLPASPSVAFIVPAPDAMVSAGFVVTAQITEARWVSRVELWINGTRHTIATPGGSPAPVVLTPPPGLADGVLAIEVRAYNDLGLRGASTITVTKGVPCADASMCNAGQQCDAGKCVTPPGAGLVGDSCNAAQDCASQLCIESQGAQSCSEICVIGGPSTCGDFECTASAEGFGVCLTPAPEATGGCCQINQRTTSPQTPWGLVVIGVLVTSLLTRRRQRIEI